MNIRGAGVPCVISGSSGGGGTSAFDWEGQWSSSTTYAIDDVVEYNGSSYIAIQAGTNKVPASEPTYWELMAAKGDTGAGGARAFYGAFHDNNDQVLASATAAQAVTIASTDDADGVSITSSSRVLFANAGVYSVTFSLQFTSVSSSIEQATVWLKKNGSDVANSSTVFDVPSKKSASIKGHTVGTLNFVFDLNSADYLEVYWSGTSTDLSLETYAAGSSPTNPVTPSVILTATQVMYSAALAWKGAWSGATAYNVDEVVEYNGSSYIAIQAGTNKQPDTQTAYWSLMASKGDTGAAGTNGTNGAGVATGGTTGQYLAKASNTNYDTTWSTFSLVNADINASAAIVYSKLSLTGSIVNADVSASAAIAYSKLSLSGSIVNADVATGAAIAYSKLSLSGSIVNADVNASAAIAWSKISKTSSSLADLATRTTANLTDFPSQTSNAGKFLKTDGSTLSWATPSGGGGFAAALLFGGF